MAVLLRIGEVGRLLGITTKTVRHYHKMRLLAEPPRTASGYRMYAASDLVQLVRIRRLHHLGLSLVQIRRILDEPTPQPLLLQAFTDVLTEVDDQIGRLQARRGRIADLLRRESWDMDQPDVLPAMLAQIPTDLVARHDAHAGSPAAKLWEQDQQIFGMLESLALPDGYTQQMEAMAASALRDPARYHRLFIIAEQLAALADVPVDSLLVEQLVSKAQVEGWRTQLEELVPTNVPEGMTNVLVNEIILSLVSPAQRRFLTLFQQGEVSTC